MTELFPEPLRHELTRSQMDRILPGVWKNAPRTLFSVPEIPCGWSRTAYGAG